MTPKPTALEDLQREFAELAAEYDVRGADDWELHRAEAYKGCAQALVPLIASEREREERLRALVEALLAETVCGSCEGMKTLALGCIKHEEGEPQMECTCGEMECPECDGTGRSYKQESTRKIVAAVLGEGE
jgi:hypothetical protein